MGSFRSSVFGFVVPFGGFSFRSFLTTASSWEVAWGAHRS